MIFASFIAALWVIHRGSLGHSSRHFAPSVAPYKTQLPRRTGQSSDSAHTNTPTARFCCEWCYFAAQSVLYPAVGYSTSSHTKSTYVLSVPGFNAINGAKKLGDLTAKNGGTTPKLSGTTFKLMFFGSKGDTMLVKDDTTLKSFSPDAYAEFGGEDSINEQAFFYAESGVNSGHWYMVCDSDRKYNMDEYPLLQGRGYIVFCGGAMSKGVTLTDSGAVGSEDLPIAMTKSTYLISGNATPRDFKVSEFAVKNGGTTPKLSGTTFKLLFFGKKTGEMMYVKDNAYLAEFNPDAFEKYGADDSINEFALYYAESGTNPNHWYMVCDGEREFIMDDYVIKAGEGFELFCGGAMTKGVTLTIPAAIEK